MARFLILPFLALPLFASAPPIPSSLDIDISSSFNGSVNVISGSYYENCTDLVVKGAEPILIHRSHISQDLKHHPGSWRFHDERISVYAAGAGFESVHQIYLKEATGGVTEFKSSVTCGYHKKDRKRWTASPIIKKGYGNTGNGSMSGKTHRGNYQLEFDQTPYSFTLTTGSGEKRVYTLQGDQPIDRDCINSHKDLWKNELEFPLKEVIKPNGNRILYSYDDNWRLIKIETYNSTQKKRLAWAQFSYLDPKGDEVSTITTSDGQRIDYHYDVKRGLGTRPRRQLILTKVIVNEYEEAHYDHHQHRIVTHTRPGGESLKTCYIRQDGDAMRDHKKEAFQVVNQWAPVGENGEEKQVSRFAYFTKQECDGYTDAWDANEHRNRYHYSEEGKVYLIEHFEKGDQEEKRCRFEWFDWNQSKLKRWAICGDKGETNFWKVFSYDDRYNVTQEDEWGTLSGSKPASMIVYPYYSHYSWYRKKHNYSYQLGNRSFGSPETYLKHYTYSEDGFNNLLSEGYDTTRIVYTYWEGTDLVKTRSTYEQNQLRLEESHEYNDAGSLTFYKKWDGYRTFIKKITYRSEEPGFGLPEWIEEFALDEGCETLIRRQQLHYSHEYQVIAQDIYDTQDKRQYTLYFEYDPMGRITKSINAVGETVDYTYDWGGRLIKKVTPTGTTHIHYDAAGRPIETEVTDLISPCRLIKASYDNAGHLICKTDPFGNTTHFSVDRDGKPTTTIHPPVNVKGTPLYPTTHATYDTWGNLISKTDENGHITTYEYQGRNQPILIRYPNGSLERFSYFTNGQLETHTDRTGLTTRYTRDSLGRPTAIKIYDPSRELLKEILHTYEGEHLATTLHPDGTLISYTYSPSGQLIEEDYEGRKTRYQYDSLQRLSNKEIVDDEGTAIYSYTYDLLDRIVKEDMFDREGNLLSWKSWEYDFEGRITLESNEGGSTKTEYGLYGPTSIIDPNGDKTLIAYHTYPRQKEVTDPLGLQTLTTYNSQGNAESILKRSSAGTLVASTTYEYDLAGRKIKETHNEGLGDPYILQWSYDSQGNPLTLTEGGLEKERTTTYSYDLANRLLSTVKPSGIIFYRTYDLFSRLATLSGPDFSEIYSYDLADRLVTIQSESGTTRRSYNQRGDLISETLESGFALTYKRSLHGQTTEVTLPDFSIFSYIYQGPQITRLIRGGDQICYHYNLSQKLIQIDSPIHSTSFTYTPAGRLKTLTAPQFQQKATYDPVGNLIELNTQNPIGTSNSRYEYDPLYQLISESGTFTNTYRYDSLHNRLQKGEEAYSHDPFNQLTQAGETPFSYNTDGENTQVGSQSYLYDSRGRLVSIELGGLKVDYTYDPFHRRLSETRYLKSLGNWYSQETLNFLYMNQQEIGSCNETGELITFHPPGPGLGGAFTAAPLLEIKGVTHFPISDFRRSIALLQSATHLKEIYQYDAFGNVHIFDSSGYPLEKSENPYRFLTKRIDDETGLIFFGRRYYSPIYGRWLTPDPRGFDDGPNLYAYCQNRPMTLIDLLGLTSQEKDEQRSSIKEVVASFMEKSREFATKPTPYSATSDNFDKAVVRTFSLQSGATTFSLGRPSLPDGTSIHFQNGIDTSPKAAIKGMEYLSDKCQGYNVICEYNPTHGPLGDVARVSAEIYYGVSTKAVEVCKKSLFDDWDQSLKVDPILNFCHSAGTTLQRNTQMKMSQEERSHIWPICLAPSGYIRPDLNPKAQHFASKRDFVPLLDIPGRAMCKEATTWLDPAPGADPWDHGIMSPTFDLPIKKSFNEKMERLRKLGLYE